MASDDLTFSGLALPDNGATAELADWAEAAFVLSGRNTVSRTALRRSLRSQLFPEDGLGSDDLAPSELDTSIDFLLAEVERRQRTCTKGYPFETSDGAIQWKPETEGLLYLFLLIVSVSSSFRASRRYAETDQWFDMIVLEALSNQLGGGARAVRFGAPASGERPKTFPAALKWLATTLGLRRGVAPARRARKDGGVDVVAWRPFADGREAFLVVLAQCTVMMKWEKKYRDIVLDQWMGWIDFRKAPATCIAIPFVVTSEFEQWDEISRGVHIVLDRLRLIELCGGELKQDQSSIWNWIVRELAGMGSTASLPLQLEPK
jgi:hypothetical protein